MTVAYADPNSDVAYTWGDASAPDYARINDGVRDPTNAKTSGDGVYLDAGPKDDLEEVIFGTTEPVLSGIITQVVVKVHAESGSGALTVPVRAYYDGAYQTASNLSIGGVAWYTVTYSSLNIAAASFYPSRFGIKTPTMGSGDDLFIYAAYLEISFTVSGTTHTVTVADNMALMDHVGGVQIGQTILLSTTYKRDQSANMGVSDNRLQSVTSNRAISDTIGMSDALSYIKASLRVVAEAMGISDFFTAPEQYTPHERLISDDMTLGHNFVFTFKTTLWTAAIQDAIGFSDLVMSPILISLGLTVTDTIGASTNVSYSMLWRRVVRNTLGTADNVLRSTIALRNISDLMGLSTHVDRSATYYRELAENLAVTDAAVLNRMFSIVLTSNMALSDNATREATIARAVSESIGFSDNAVRSAINLRTISESLGISDAVSRALTALRLLSDNLGVATSAGIPAHDWALAITETLGISDSVVRSATSMRALAETLGMADSPSLLTIWLRQFTDQFNLSTQVSTVTISDASGYVGGDVDALVADVDGAEAVEEDVDGAEAVQSI